MVGSLTETDHCEVGAEMALRWNFPIEIQNALRWYVKPLAPEGGLLAAVVNISGHVAHGLELGQTPEEVTRCSIPVLARLSMNRTQSGALTCRILPAASDQFL